LQLEIVQLIYCVIPSVALHRYNEECSPILPIQLRARAVLSRACRDSVPLVAPEGRTPSGDEFTALIASKISSGSTSDLSEVTATRNSVLASSPYSEPALTEAMDAGKIDAVIFPTWAQLPAINGDRNTQLVAEPKPAPSNGPTALGSGLTFVGSSLQWPGLSVPSGYLGEGLPQGLQILGRAWDEAKIIGYAFAYEQATHHRRPPPTTPPLDR
jgi:Asp-tRNA(Asn)/Glu-tRNA(Gln) amidotransferase A subunit family amidase